MKKVKIVYLFILALILIGCSSNVNVEIFRFVNHENTIQVGEKINLQLIMGDYPEDSEVKYTLSKEDIISFEDGVAEGLKVGEVEVRATVDNKKFATTRVIVTKEPIDALQILADKNLIYVDQTLQLSTKVFPNHFSNEVTWSIEIGSDVATITAEGLLKPLRGEKDLAEVNANGAKVRVVATSVVDNSVKAKRDFIVKYRSTTLITVSAPENKTNFTFEELATVDSIQLTVGKLPTNSYPIASYATSDATIMLVDQQGLITLPETLKAGTVTITVRALDGKSGSITFTIVESNDVVE